ncbi:MAG: ornithine cyclodeaminase family protein [Actinomycetota bacterium]
MLILNRAEVEALLDLDSLIDALEPGFVDLSEGRTSVPPRVAAFAPEGFLASMPGYVPGVLAAKLVSVYHSNPSKGLPGHHALMAMFDPDRGTPLVVMDGTAITAARTACASAVATRILARAEVVVLTVIGAGVQGRAHIEAVPRVRRFTEIRIASRTFAHAEALARESNAVAVRDVETAVRGADVICLCTDSATPVLDRSWVSPGTHINSVGVSLRGGELDDATVRASQLVVESRIAFEPPPAGAVELHGFDPNGAAELGEILRGRRAGRSSPEEITVYKSMGHAVEDAVAARLVYELALQKGLGTRIKM